MTGMPPQDAAVNEVSDLENPVLDTAGNLEVRLATTDAEVEESQRLRYEVFYREMNAQPSAEMEASGRDFDHYDAICKHMLVIDRARDGKIIGTYRMLREDAAAKSPYGFYTSGEYDISEMLKARAGQRLLELGRSCVLKEYRTGPTMQLLWRGIFVYLLRHNIDLMFGCASLPGTDPKVNAYQLAYLYYFHLTPKEERVRALPERYSPMDLIPREQIDEAEVLRTLPPLVKGYIRSGARIGDGAVIDHQFGTTDVFIYLPTASLHPRWASHLRKKIAASTQPA